MFLKYEKSKIIEIRLIGFLNQTLVLKTVYILTEFFNTNFDHIDPTKPKQNINFKTGPCDACYGLVI